MRFAVSGMQEVITIPSNIETKSELEKVLQRVSRIAQKNEPTLIPKSINNAKHAGKSMPKLMAKFEPKRSIARNRQTSAALAHKKNEKTCQNRQRISKMDPKIVKIQESMTTASLQPSKNENLVFEVSGPPKSDQKSSKNVI